MADKFNKILEYFNTAIGILRGVGSAWKMVLLIAIFALVVAGVALSVVLGVVSKVKEKHGQFMNLETKYPRLFAMLYGGKTRFLLLLVVISLLLIDWRDATTISPPSGVPKAPPAPIVQYIQQPALGCPAKNNLVPSLPKPVVAPLHAALTAPPTQAPLQKPTVISAYEKVGGVEGEVRILDEALGNAFRAAENARGKGGTEDEFKEPIFLADKSVSRQWSDMQPRVKADISEAIELLRQAGGKNHLTPNQALKEADKYIPALQAADKQMSLSDIGFNKPMLQLKRFEPLIDYLHDLHSRLGDY